MRRVVLLAILALVLPIAALADSITFTATGNIGGTATGLPAAQSTGSVTNGGDYTLTVPLGTFTDTTGTGTVSTLSGTVSFDTGTLTKTGTDTFSFSGTVTITNSTGGTLFNSAVTGNVVTSGSGKNEIITITGSLPGGGLSGVVGIQSNGRLVTISGNAVTGGTTVTPEPGTLGLLGTGLVGIAGLIRRKVRMG